MSMRAAIRTDASRWIGSGHVMRCLTLAESLAAHGWEVAFLCRAFAGDLIPLIESRGFPVRRLPGLAPGRVPEDLAGQLAAIDAAWEADATLTREALHAAGGSPDLLVVDHYGLDRRWELAVAGEGAAKVLVIDDLANRPHACDLLLDQNYTCGMERRYHGLVPPGCRLLLGPTYALLRPEFRAARRELRRRDGRVRRLLVFFGGADPTNETVKALEALRLLAPEGVACDVVVGSQNPHAEEVRARCAALPGAAFHCQVDYMARLLAQADLALGAGGSSTWERCFLGLPSLTIVVADNQEETTRCLGDRGVVRNLGPSSKLSAAALAAAVRDLLGNPGAVAAMSEACLALMGGNTETAVGEAIDEVLGRPAGETHV